MKYLKKLKKYFVNLSSLTARFLKRLVRISCLAVVGIFLLYPLGLPEPEGITRDYMQWPSEGNVEIPFESFVYIVVHSESFMNSSDSMTASASGIVIQTLNEEKTYILTAGHACEPLMVIFGASLDMIDGAYQSKSTVEVYDYFGFVHEAKILGIDPESDLCLLESEDVWNPGLPISRAMPKTGERVYSIAAPRSIFSPGNALLFDGYYTGLDQSMDAYFTIPARPGSSGAGIINSDGHIVGIIHSAAVELENLAIASSVYDIDTFLSNYIIYVSGY